jgi:hypothetical protein
MEGIRQATAAEFKKRLAQRLAAEAFECDGNCGLSEQECWDKHELHWTATANGVVHLDGSSEAIAHIAMRVAQELGLLP